MFERLRHSMLVQAGANGNVFGYNYSVQPMRVEWPFDASSDITVHGNFRRYYPLTDRPDFWTLAEPLPVIGPPHDFLEGATLPARERQRAGGAVARCP